MTRLRALWPWVRPFRGPLIGAVVLTGLLTVVGMAPPLLMRALINDMAAEGRWGLFELVVGLLLAVPVAQAILNVVNGVVLNRVSLGIIARTRKRLFRHLMSLSMRFFDRMPVGGITQRLMGEVGAVSGVVTSGLVTLLIDLVAVVFALSVMLGLSWKLSLVTLGLLPLYYLNYRFFSPRIKDNNATLRSHMDHISSSLQQRLSAHELVQSYGQERAEAAHFSSRARQIMDAAVRGTAYNVSFTHLAAFINKLGNTLIYSAGCYFFVTGSMGYGDVVAFCAYAIQLLGPIVRFSSVANQIVQAGVSVDRLNEILQQEPDVKERPDPRPVPALRGDVRVDNVSFGYRQNAPVLQEVSLDIPAGRHVALVGTNGAGRSTLALLLRRFYDPQDGRIQIDGYDIRDLRIRELRHRLAMVPRESTIFDGTIRENLCYGRPGAEEARMVAVSEAVGLHAFVAGLAKGYDTRLGTGGLRLSAGDQQRIGIARALLAEPSILITDQATWSLDPDSAHDVLAAIRQQMQGRTCLLIVHRALMARGVDQVIVMDSGRIVQRGAHESLLRQPKGPYRIIVGTQYGRRRLPPVEGE